MPGNVGPGDKVHDIGTEISVISHRNDDNFGEIARTMKVSRDPVLLTRSMIYTNLR